MNASSRPLIPARVLLDQGRSAAPPFGHTRFLRTRGVRSELDHKRTMMAQGRVMYHAHVGLSTWAQTEAALVEITTALRDEGHHLDRYGLALDRAMGMPEGDRDATAKETGPRLSSTDWQRLGEVADVQPHLGDHMIGFPAGFENTLHALRAGVTTIGNIGQYVAFDLVGGSDEIVVTEETVRALGCLAALRDRGVLAHSNLDDGNATQASNYGAFVGWAALELHVVEELIGARLAHCYGNMVQRSEARAVLHFALDDLRGRASVGSMVYGNTVDHRAGAIHANRTALREQLRCDIALQLHRPTGHAVNPVPLTEAERIPSAAEIVDVQLFARAVERDVVREMRQGREPLDWARLERCGAELAAYARSWAAAVLASFENDGVDVRDAAQVLLAMRRASMGDLERVVRLPPPPAVERLVPWKTAQLERLASSLRAAPRLDGQRVVLAVLEVHDVVRDALARALPRAGAEVIVLGAGASIDAIAAAASQEDADAIVLGVYNGNALALGSQLTRSCADRRWEGRIFMGGLLNQDMGDGLPVDARPRLEALGVRCIDRVEELFGALAAAD